MEGNIERWLAVIIISVIVHFLCVTGFPRRAPCFIVHYNDNSINVKTLIGTYLWYSLSNFFSGHDTVGAVAVDYHGNVACCTSTGGITRQVAGRISDSGIIGSGGYADNESGTSAGIHLCNTSFYPLCVVTAVTSLRLRYIIALIT